MINYKQLKVMINLQNIMNATVDTNWINKDWDWFRASMLEGAEGIEHHGWKWWKAQNKDLAQLQMEIVDIWHFYLSEFIRVSKGNEEDALNLIKSHYEEHDNKLVNFDYKQYDLTSLPLLNKLDLLIGLAASKRYHVPLILSIVKDCDMDWVKFYEMYVNKNVLNIFRQKNGYKQGTYHKEWFGKEDNIYLEEISKKLNPSNDDYYEVLWSELEKTYQQALSEKNTH